MLHSASPFSRSSLASPPSRQPASTSKLTQAKDLSAAQHSPKDTLGKGAVLATLGLATMALTGCVGQPTEPPPDPGAYEIENPELVVMSDSVERIDIARETDTDCTGFGEDETCTTSNVPYHRLGVHVGEGVVQDLNGNLFAAPQLIMPGAPGIAISNPSGVQEDAGSGIFATEGRLTQKDHDTLTMSGSRFGRGEIDQNGNEIKHSSRGIGGRWERLRVTTNDGVANIKESRHTAAIVQSQGDHVLVQTGHGGKFAEIRHDEAKGEYEVRKPGLFGSSKTTVTFKPGEVKRQNGRWQGNSVTESVNAQGQTEFLNKAPRWDKGTTTTVTQDGFKEQANGFLGGGPVTVKAQGGETLPGQ